MQIGLVGLGKMGGNMRTRLRNKGIEVGNDKVAGKFDGYTETWLVKDLMVNKIIDLMDFVRETEDK